MQSDHPFPSRSAARSVRWILALTVFFLAGALVGAASAKNMITGLESSRDGDRVQVVLKATAAPTYTVYELFKPARVVVDVAEAELAKDFSGSLPENSGISFKTSAIDNTTPPLLRFTFTLEQSRPFTVKQEGTAIAIDFAGTKADQATTAQPAATPAPESTKAAPGDKGRALISDVKVTTTPSETVVRLVADRSLKYSQNVLEKDEANPPRLYLDIDNASGDTLLKERKVGTALADIRVARRGSGLRFVLDGAGDTLFPFRIQPLADGLAIHIQEDNGTGQKDAISDLIEEKTSVESQLPTVDLLGQKEKAKDLKSKMEDAFSFSGYTKERITVDFYKIDLHNVFRLLREVSGKNIVVDESVNGSLTLALNDVPWDFALDIILNLKDLQKEERFNTIVIHPKSKEFTWPKRAEDNLSFEADEKVTEQEAILIQQQMAIPPTVIEAKRFIKKGREFEKREEYEYAVKQYERALDKWPDNGRLANKIAAIYLVHLGQNAKALYFAKKALKADGTLVSAALNAAIAAANMQDSKQALAYFDQAVHGKKPPREALLSYAVFSEQQKQYPEAIKLLTRHDNLYGANLQSMITQARILDKMGRHQEATAAYKKIALSGFRIPPDLRKYIQGRIALSQPM